MQFLRVVLAVGVVLSQVYFGARVQATTSGGVVISQVQAGNASSSRLIEIYNNSDQPVDVTGWCVRYVSASAVLSFASSSVRACFATATAAQRLVVPERSYVVIGSSQLGLAGADMMMSEGLGSGPSGKVYVTNGEGQVVDVFGWGNETVNAEGTPKASTDNAARVYERLQVTSGNYVDTNNNSADFFAASLRAVYSVGSLTEMTDYCLNMPAIQPAIPEGFIASDDGNCYPEQLDICANMEGVQTTLPPTMEVDESGNCYADACSNLPGFQDQIPRGFSGDDDGICRLGLWPIIVTELLPNPAGDDKDNEFIEFYNPSDETVDLTYYVFHLNGDYGKAYSFPVGFTIAAQSYAVLTHKDSAFTLTNTAGSLRLRTLDAAYVYNVPEYTNAKDDQSWALINGVWQWTTIPTPGAANELPPAGMGSMVAGLTDCGEGRERNPLTNRCRNIPTASVLAPCKEGQYRSEETNRCRSIATAAASVLKPCGDDQFRNPLTNRCKKIASSDDLADCGEGRERNPDTNRCRNVLGVASVPASTFAVQPIADGGMAFVGWWALGGIGLLAAGYAGWEWRRELTVYGRRVVSFFSGKG